MCIVLATYSNDAINASIIYSRLAKNIYVIYDHRLRRLIKRVKIGKKKKEDLYFLQLALANR